MMHSKMLSVLMPFHNAEETLENAIDLILAQTYKNFSFYLLDNFSTDNSLIIAENKKKLTLE